MEGYRDLEISCNFQKVGSNKSSGGGSIKSRAVASQAQSCFSPWYDFNPITSTFQLQSTETDLFVVKKYISH